MKQSIAVWMMALVASCAPVQPVDTTTRAAVSASTPTLQGFADRSPVRVTRSNGQMAQDFLDLTFRMESGRAIATMSRFETPITVRVIGDMPATLPSDLDALLARLRKEAGIDIRPTQSDSASITIQAIPQRTLQRAVPKAACFVVPRVRDWSEYMQNRSSRNVDWATLTTREHASIFVPSDAAPQEIRDCLHEELAQALGPLNDLYRLPDSVFNDDNIHAVLTGFDMLMLRTTYAPELRSGMTRQQVAAALPSVLARLNPAGGSERPTNDPDTSRDWINAMETALTNGASPGVRRDSAARAVRIARTLGWTGPREGFSYYAMGRLEVGNNSQAAIVAFETADRIYRASAATQIHAAHIAVQKAAFTLSAGDAITTIELADLAIPLAREHQNAALLATLMMFKAEALDLQGGSVAAEALRLDSLPWARYGFGNDNNVRARLAEVRGLRPF
ncbi:DUF2927 domain-containing protein [Loktanella sp. SALINAS62]|uniref:DUF2927 domain-containing protein n=1 Tax=Loktanella sp. SALINAS62 TaxID=2706124 RepID=UPI001B8AC0BB|nr:DUF2927 domain-containing protein [Loktanella sp. SALINAS62]MBS1304177.1 DUF2927 domain-containing protein [Loktanella sp. SALINAS62]